MAINFSWTGNLSPSEVELQKGNREHDRLIFLPVTSAEKAANSGHYMGIPLSDQLVGAIQASRVLL